MGLLTRAGFRIYFEVRRLSRAPLATHSFHDGMDTLLDIVA
jgi:hypothetical protein